MDFIVSFAWVLAMLMLGEWVSTKTKAWIPSVFVTGMLFVIGFWTVMPKDIVTKASFGPQFTTICVMMLLVHLGTLMNLKELMQQWKAVCIALLGVAGTMVLTMTIGTMIFDWHTVVAAVPPLTGGIVAAVLMADGLKAQGIMTLVALPVSMFVLHSLVGYPLISSLLKKEGRRLLGELHNGTVGSDPNAVLGHAGDQEEKELVDDVKKVEKKPLHINVPESYQTSAYILVKVAVVAVLAALFSKYTNNLINSAVVCLVFGVIAHQLGFLESRALNKAGVFNWLMYGLLAYVFGQLNVVDPSNFLTIVIQIVVLLILGVLGMFIASFILGRPFGMSWYMAFACSLTALCGFPADYVLSTEVCHNLAGDNKEEEQFLLDNILPKMLIGGFATVSVASVIIASLFLKLL